MVVRVKVGVGLAAPPVFLNPSLRNLRPSEYENPRERIGGLERSYHGPFGMIKILFPERAVVTAGQNRLSRQGWGSLVMTIEVGLLPHGWTGRSEAAPRMGGGAGNQREEHLS